MIAVHSVRAVYTALSGVPGIQSAEVTMGRARLEHEDPLDREGLTQALAVLSVEISAMREARRHLTIRGDQPDEA